MFSRTDLHIGLSVYFLEEQLKDKEYLLFPENDLVFNIKGQRYLVNNILLS